MIPAILAIGLCVVIYYTIKTIRLNREAERMRIAKLRAKRKESELIHPRIVCTKVLECKTIKHERGVNQFIAFRGCPAASICPDFESLNYKFYKDVCEYWDRKEVH